jgi:hypothetical protein
MSDRARRIGENEALFRQVNEHVQSLGTGVAEGHSPMQIFCECGDLSCDDRFSVPSSKYEEIRGDATLFFVVPGHNKVGIEEVVERTEDYDVVRKLAAEARRIAEETDPRS